MEGLVQGSIVVAEVCDPRGQNKKRRPVLIITATDEIKTADTLVAVFVSNTAAREKPRPKNYIALPWNKDGRCKTKLVKESVAICGGEWNLEIEKAQIISRIGFCHPPDVLEKVLEAAGATKPKSHATQQQASQEEPLRRVHPPKW